MSPARTPASPVIVDVHLSAEIDVERETDFVRRDLTIPSVRLSDFVVK
jgi:hypothetical protein